MKLRCRVHPGEYRVGQLAHLPDGFEHLKGWFSLSVSADEISIICPVEWDLSFLKSEPGWGLIEVAGPFEFSTVGVLAWISSKLAEAGIPLLAVSTIDTDYILVKTESLDQAVGVAFEPL